MCEKAYTSQLRFLKGFSMAATLAWIAISLLLAGIAVHLTTEQAFAQGARTSLSGSVKDSAGAVIPGVTVTAKDAAGTSMETITNEAGLFRFPSINPGTYQLTVVMPGFKKAVLENIIVEAASPASVDIPLQIGEIQETVEVTAVSTVVQTESTTVAVSVDTDAIKNLPMMTRNVM